MISVVRHDDVPVEEIARLDRALANYYAEPPESYYEIADQAALQYEPQFMPFHCDLLHRVAPGMHLLELGCGSAHLCPQVTARGGNYTGVDHSVTQMRKNQDRFPDARFFDLKSPLHETFDIVASLYTIEHVVDPPAYLERMWKLCKPGGLLAVICPEFIDNDSYPPSLFFGKTARRLKAKLRSLDFLDAACHLADLWWQAPRWKRKAQRTALGAFWLNLKPRVLHGATYSVDADAIHQPRLADIVDWFEKRGAETITTSRSLPDVDPEVLRFNCYTLARKKITDGDEFPS